jgi:pterin-4a-carbinolamine dehydratase
VAQRRERPVDVTVSLQTKKIKDLHENDFIIAAKLDRIADTLDSARC